MLASTKLSIEDEPVVCSIVDPAKLSGKEMERLHELTLFGNSDLARLLTDLHDGKTEGVILSFARWRGRVIGWAAVDKWRHLVLMNCYVDEEFRERGIGTELVRTLVKPYKELYQVRPFVDGDAMSFYLKAALELFKLPKAKRPASGTQCRSSS